MAKPTAPRSRRSPRKTVSKAARTAERRPMPDWLVGTLIVGALAVGLLPLLITLW